MKSAEHLQPEQVEDYDDTSGQHQIDYRITPETNPQDVINLDDTDFGKY
jgi:hypothetical protein